MGFFASKGFTERFEQAFLFSHRVHKKQQRKGGTIPYIIHPMAVASLVSEGGGDEDQVIAALLHDCIEDGEGDKTRQEIYAAFGDRVGGIVDGCTDTDKKPKPPWRQRKESYIAHAREAGTEVLLVSCADKLHNVRTILADFRAEGDKVWDKFAPEAEETIWYYRTLADLFKERLDCSLVDELDRVLLRLENEVRGHKKNPDA